MKYLNLCFWFGFLLILSVLATSHSSSSENTSALQGGFKQKIRRFFGSRRSQDEQTKTLLKKKRTSLLKRVLPAASSSEPVDNELDKIPKLGLGIFYNSSDPLHAYPTKADILVHDIFQRVATFEINNAATVRTLLNSARITFWIGLVLGAVGLAVPLSTAIPLGLKRADEKEDQQVDDYPAEYWDYVDRMTQSVLHSIQNGELQYGI